MTGLGFLSAIAVSNMLRLSNLQYIIIARSQRAGHGHGEDRRHPLRRCPSLMSAPGCWPSISAAGAGCCCRRWRSPVSSSRRRAVIGGAIFIARSTAVRVRHRQSVEPRLRRFAMPASASRAIAAAADLLALPPAVLAVPAGAARSPACSTRRSAQLGGAQRSRSAARPCSASASPR